MTQFPYSFRPDGEADELKYSKSTRVDEVTHQRLLDFQSDFGFPNQSATVRNLLYFALEYVPRVMDEDSSIVKRMKAESNADRAIREYERRAAAYERVIDLMMKAASTDSIPVRLTLEKSAQEIAESYVIPWPLPNLPLISRDPDSAYVLRRIKEVMGKRQSNVIKLSELNRAVGKFNARELETILHSLEDEDFIILAHDSTPGPNTVLISLPQLIEI